MTTPLDQTERAAFEAWYEKEQFVNGGDLVIAPDGDYRQGRVQVAWEAWQAAIASRAAPEQKRHGVDVSHFSAFYLLSNARRFCSTAYKHKPNWVLAMELFAVGSNSAFRICRESNLDPDATGTRPLPAPPTPPIAAKAAKETT